MEEKITKRRSDGDEKEESRMEKESSIVDLADLAEQRVKAVEKERKQNTLESAEVVAMTDFNGVDVNSSTTQKYRRQIASFWRGEFQNESERSNFQNIATSKSNVDEEAAKSKRQSSRQHENRMVEVGRTSAELCSKTDTGSSAKERLSDEGTSSVRPGAVAVGRIDSLPASTEGANFERTLLSSNRSSNSSRLYVKQRSSIEDSTRRSENALEATLVEEGEITDDARARIREEVRSEFIDRAVIAKAEALVDHEKAPMGEKKRWVLLLAGLLLCGLVVMFVVRATDSSDPDTQLSESGDDLPTSEPTFGPFIPIEKLDNTLMAEAHELVLGSTPLRSMNEGELWYTYRARISGPVTVVTCQTTGLELFETVGTSVREFTADVSYQGDMKHCNGESASWQTQKGKQYHVKVHSSIDTAGRDKLFNSSVIEKNIFSIQAVDNDQCEFAFGPMEATENGLFFSYTTTGATIDFNVPSCGDVPASTSPGVWYTVRSSGQAIVANTCSGKTNFDTQLSVFKGTCYGLVCVGGSDDFCDQKSKVVWAVEKEELYYIYIQGKPETSGDFELQISGNY